MAQPARYLFDLDFSAPPEPEIEEVVEEEIIEEEPPEPMITVAEHEALIETIRQQAYEQGLAEGREEREQSATEQSVALQKSILDEIAMVYTEVGTLLSRLERDASRLAFTFASRFAEKLVAQEPKAEVQALLNQILAPLRKSPHLIIRIHSSLADEIKQSTEDQMKELGFKGSLMVTGDDAVAPGDCEVEWNDGGIGRNMRAAIHHAEELLEQHFAHIPEEEAEDENDQDASSPETSEDQETMSEAKASADETASEINEAADAPAPDLSLDMPSQVNEPQPDIPMTAEAPSPITSHDQTNEAFDPNQSQQPQGEPQ
jgi:flagellar assembly protein FliH